MQKSNELYIKNDFKMHNFFPKTISDADVALEFVVSKL